MKHFITLAITIFFATTGLGQNKTITFNQANRTNVPSRISSNYSEFEVFSFDIKQLKYQLANRNTNVELVFPGWTTISTELTPSYILADDFTVSVIDMSGKNNYTLETEIVTLQGYTPHGEIRLTLNDNYINGFIDIKEGRRNIETIGGLSGETNFTIVNEKNRFKKISSSCNHELRLEKDIPNTKEESRSAGQCYQVSLAQAADHLMVEKHGGIDETINHMVSVINNVQANFTYSGDTNFGNGIEFNIEEVTLATCSKCDPWTTSTDFLRVYMSYAEWAKYSKYSSDYHIGQFWTARDFDHSYVGLAGYDSYKLCDHSRYQILQDFTSSSAYLQAMVSHELGHNFGASHSLEENSIMNSKLMATNRWDDGAKEKIGSEIIYQRSCLHQCGSNDCDPVTGLEVKNIKEETFELHWNGLPTDRYKVLVMNSVTKEVIYTAITKGNYLLLRPSRYDICQRYEVQMIRECSSWQSDKMNLFFSSPEGQGCSDFKMESGITWENTAISVSDESINANSWLWDFGDGTMMDAQSPTHNYVKSDIYDIVLSVNHGAHETYKTISVLPELNLPYNAGGNFETSMLEWASEAEVGNDLWSNSTQNINPSNTTQSWNAEFQSGQIYESDSYLYSPKYNFSDNVDYMMNFNLSMNAPTCFSPFALQMHYSIDNGVTWMRLGSYGNTQGGTKNWYNKGKWSSCGVSKHLFYDQHGWIMSQNDVEVSYNLAGLKGKSSVIFRFALLAIDGELSSTESYGVSIDDFNITSPNLGTMVDNNPIAALESENSNELSIEEEPAAETRVSETVYTEIGIYPNPNFGTELFVRNDQNEKIDRIEVYNNLGQKVISSLYKTRIDISTLTPGSYIVTFISNDNIVINKKLQRF